MGILSLLLKVLAYLPVKQRAKQKVDRLCLVVGILVGLPLGYSKSINLVAANGLISGINGLFQILVGFYIASLAAVTTFDGTGRGYDLDSPLTSYPAIIKNDDGRKESISRRRLLSLLFSYLALSSLLLYVFGLFIQVIYPLIHEIPDKILHLLRVLFMECYSVLFFHILGSTILSLFFMGYRMNVKVSADDLPAFHKHSE